MNLILIKAEWDVEASVWVATSDDVAGLVAEADQLEQLRAKVLLMIEDLIEEKVVSSDLLEIPVHIITHSFDRVVNRKVA